MAEKAAEPVGEPVGEKEPEGKADAEPGESPGESAERLAARLAEQGRMEPAHGLRRALTRGAERAVLLALDEVCQTFLSAVEAFDPETEGMIEELRLSIDRRLKGPGEKPKKA